MKDPTPQFKDDYHGTRCAGEIAAVANNDICGVGVAYGSKVAGLRILSAPVTDAIEARAITYAYNITHIYSNSWGPNDNGKEVDGPGRLFQRALIDGTRYGRNGKGSIIVFAGGNGGNYDDNCNFDGYANSIYTLTIGAIDNNNQKPPYGELCAAQLAVTYSKGTSDHIVSLWVKKPNRKGGRRLRC
jgi:kexin